MEKENATKLDVLNDLFGIKCVTETPSPKKRKSPSNSDEDESTPPKNRRMPLSPIKDSNTNSNHDHIKKKDVKKSLFGQTRSNNIIIEEKNISIQTTPKKERQKSDEIFGKIKAALSLENPGEILGRETETTEVTEFIKAAIKDDQGQSLYISGQPGTGKSATINNIISKINFKKLKARKVFLNCMSVETSTGIYAQLLDRFESNIPIPKTVRWQKSKFHQFITSEDTPMCVLILDEMDQLNSKNEKVLYDLFELAADEESRMILIGIANGLDLLERVLPNLPKTKKPKQMNFMPYSFQQIFGLIKARLTPEMLTKLELPAIMMCSKRIAALAGDARKALDVLRRATEVAGIEKSAKVKITHVNSVLNQTYTDRSGAELPFHQQLAIIAFIKLAREEKFQCTINDVMKEYKKIAASRRLPTESDPNFKEGIELLVQAAMVSKIQKPRKITKFELAMNEDDAATKLGQKSKTILSILE